MRPVWKGYISFGLVNIPIILYSAEKNNDIHFHLLDKKTNDRVGYEYINKETGKVLNYNDITKGYEIRENEFIQIDEEVIKKIAGENTKTIAIETFVNEDEISPLHFSVPYYLVPDKKGIKGYVILRQALESANKIGIAKVIIHSHEKLAAIMPYENALILNIIRFHHEIRQPDEFELPTENLKDLVTPKEMQVAKQLIQSMSEKWRPETYEDEYQNTLRKWLEERARVKNPKAKMQKRAASIGKGNIINFIDLLKKSIKENSRSPKRAKK